MQLHKRNEYDGEFLFLKVLCKSEQWKSLLQAWDHTELTCGREAMEMKYIQPSHQRFRPYVSSYMHSQMHYLPGQKSSSCPGGAASRREGLLLLQAVQSIHLRLQHQAE